MMIRFINVIIFNVFVYCSHFLVYYLQYTPDNSNLQGTDENGSS